MSVNFSVLKQLAVFMVIVIILSVSAHLLQFNLMIRKDAYAYAVRHLREIEASTLKDGIGEIKKTRLSLASLLQYSPPGGGGGEWHRVACVKMVVKASGGDFLVSMNMEEDGEESWSVLDVVIEDCSVLNCLM